MQMLMRFQEHRKQRFNVVTLALGSWTKLGMTKELGWKREKVVLGLKHIPTSVGKCKRMNPNTLNWIPTLRVRRTFSNSLKTLEQGSKGQTLFKLNIF
jgi:hypothetical protein